METNNQPNQNLPERPSESENPIGNEVFEMFSELYDANKTNKGTLLTKNEEVTCNFVQKKNSDPENPTLPYARKSHPNR